MTRPLVAIARELSYRTAIAKAAATFVIAGFTVSVLDGMLSLHSPARFVPSRVFQWHRCP